MKIFCRACHWSWIFGQRPQRGRSPVEHRGTFVRPSVRSSVRSFIRSFPPPSGPSGLKSSLSGLKFSLSGHIWPLRPQIWPLRPQIWPPMPQIWPPRPLIWPLRPQIWPLRPQSRPLRPQIWSLRAQISHLNLNLLLSGFKSVISPFNPQVSPLKLPIGIFRPYMSFLRPQFRLLNAFSQPSIASHPLLQVGQTKVPLCSTGLRPLRSRCFPSLQFTITQSRATGIADHILPLGDLLLLLLPTVRHYWGSVYSTLLFRMQRDMIA